MDKDPIVVAGAARTPVGAFQGSLARASAAELGATAIGAAIERAGVAPDIINEVMMGCVLPAGQGQAPARQVALGADMPVGTPATTINKVCGSALKAVMMAANSIRAGEYNVIVAGGMESMSNAPYFGHKISRTEFGEMQPTMVHDGLWDVYNDEHMGNTGETIAKECDISRESADAFAARSHELAEAAWNQGWMDFEVVDTPGIERDEGILPGGDLAEMKAAFSEGGQITAGNSSQLSDGAAAVLVSSREAAEANGWPVLATIHDYCTSGVEPARVMAAPIPAIETLLGRNGLTMDDLAYVEHNEAFAAASCAIAKTCHIPDDKLNPHGGAVAIGHPLGATGARCLMTLINALRRTGGGKGIVTLCLGGGNAVAMLIEA